MAVEPGDCAFQSKLDDASKKKAREELNELNDKDREIAVQSFRSWVLEQKWLTTPTDFEFLLRFLRARKFSQLGARATLENYWTIKTKCPKWFKDVDLTDKKDKKVLEILRTGFYICPKTYDKQGRRIIIEQMSKLNLKDINDKWGVDNVFRAIALVCDWINRDENIQVNGLNVFIDNTDVKMGHFFSLMTRENGKNIMQFYQNSLPCRMKGLHLYNEATIFDAVFAIFGPLMKQKMKDRMHLHGKNMANVYKHVDMCTLPDEYLPDDYDGPSAGPSSKILEDMISDMTSPEFRGYIKSISGCGNGVDLKQRKCDEQVPIASFRKLNVD